VKKSILQDSHFENDANGHGGDRRTLQITELIHTAGLSIEKVRKTDLSRISKYLEGISFLMKYPSYMTSSFRWIGECGYESLSYKNILREHLGSKLLVWEATSHTLASCVAKNSGYKVMALSHNLESLVSGPFDQLDLGKLLKKFSNEIQALAQSDAVFCISREEQWLLKLCGVDADFLPYYPPVFILERLLELRYRRISPERKKFLIVGTALNPPTLAGMLQQLDLLKKIRGDINFDVDIAGYGTEQLAEYCDHQSFNLLGAIKPQELDILMLNAKAVLVHQKAGVGALTRIPEMIIAGVPVIANSNACRSALHYSGVYCYDSAAELVALMKSDLPVPELLQRPIMAEQRFVDCLRSLV
jgi:glycosyltransferase involved in cell wall biosynthesis